MSSVFIIFLVSFRRYLMNDHPPPPPPPPPKLNSRVREHKNNTVIILCARDIRFFTLCTMGGGM